MNWQNIALQLLNAAVVGTLTVERALALKAKVDAMIAEGRDPTDEEWAELEASIDAAGDRLEAADKLLNP